MSVFAGLDVLGKRAAMGVVDEAGKIVWRGMVRTLELLAAALRRFAGKRAKAGLASAVRDCLAQSLRPFTPRLFRSLAAMAYP
ncbi:MAG: hypothetical protein ACREDM_14335, partial [Methylocella sp.]